jgi:hypothetical protein
MTSIKVVYSFAFYPLPVFVDISFLGIDSFKETGIPNLRIWHVESLENLFRRLMALLSIWALRG